MAVVEIAFFTPANVGGPMDVANPDSVTMITSSASNQISTNQAAFNGVACAVTSSGGRVYALIGTGSPDATVSASLRRLIPDGATRVFENVPNTAKVGIVDA